jgi:outer membrane protein assembly factor BamB
MRLASQAAVGRGRRVTLALACALLALAGTAFTARRVFGAAEVVTDAAKPYPATAATATPGVIGTFAAAPLIVDGRLRVYATTRQVRADLPVDARTQRSPFWSFRRWPEQLVGVVAVGATVVSRWSDGALIAIDGRTGRVAWRAEGPPPGTSEYTGRRTGAGTVYRPDGLFIAGPVVLARGGTEALAVHAGGGRELWRRTVAGRECRGDEFTTAFTTAGGRYVYTSGCDASKRIESLDATTGRPVGLRPATQRVTRAEPLGCRVGRSECAGARITEVTGDKRGWLLTGDRPVEAPADAWLAGDLAITQTPDGDLIGRRAASGEEVWRAAPGRGRLLAAQPGRLHLLTEDYWLVTLDSETGVERSRFLFTYGRERLGWTVGHTYADGSFVLVERLARDGDPLDRDADYYFIAQPVLLAGT